MTDFDELLPEDIIEANWLDSYKKEIDFLWRQLVHLNTNLYILEKIISSRLDLFLQSYKTVFWKHVINNFYADNVLKLWKLVSDNDPKSLTIPKFKNGVLKNIKKDLLSDFKTLLKANKLDKGFHDISKKIDKMRHKIIAHNDREYNLVQNTKITISLKEIKKIASDIRSLFDLICFGDGRDLLITEYSNPAIKTDIDEILENLVRNSVLLNEPENDPFWEIIKNNYYQKEISILNEWRKKFNLPAV